MSLLFTCPRYQFKFPWPIEVVWRFTLVWFRWGNERSLGLYHPKEKGYSRRQLLSWMAFLLLLFQWVMCICYMSICKKMSSARSCMQWFLLPQTFFQFMSKKRKILKSFSQSMQPWKPKSPTSLHSTAQIDRAEWKIGFKYPFNLDIRLCSSWSGLGLYCIIVQK